MRKKTDRQLQRRKLRGRLRGYCRKICRHGLLYEVRDRKLCPSDRRITGRGCCSGKRLGDIYDWKTGQKIAGLLAENKKSFRSTEELMYASTKVVENKFTGNTTIGVVLTNGKFHKTSLCKIAGMAHDGFARSIRPVHTSADGDSIYAVSVGDVSADQDLVGTLAGEVMSEAIIRAVESAESAYGYPGLGSWKME